MIIRILVIAIAISLFVVATLVVKETNPVPTLKLDNRSTTANRRLRWILLTLGTVSILVQGILGISDARDAERFQDELLSNQSRLERIVSPVTNFFRTTDLFQTVEELASRVTELGPRLVTKLQRDRFLAAVRGGSKGGFRFTFSQTDPEAGQYAAQLMSLWSEAGMAVTDAGAPMIIEDGESRNGLRFHVSGPANRPFDDWAPQHLLTVLKGLEAANIKAEIMLYTNGQPSGETVSVTVRTKPPR